MRLVGALLWLGLTAPIASADDAKPADPKPEVVKKRVPLRVVKLLPETHQVLLFDKHKGSHVVAEVGQTVEGYLVDAIDEDEVTLISETGAEVILTAPAPSAPSAPRAEAKPVGKKPSAEPQPVDPYGEVPAPDADALGASLAVAPGEGGVRVASVAAPSAAPSAASAPSATTLPGGLADPYSDPVSSDPGIAAFIEAVGAAPAKPAMTGMTGMTGPTRLSRPEVNAALGDFTRLSSSFRATHTPAGLRFDAVSDGSLLAKIGLRKGDVVTAVDGHPLASIDDAADLYARAWVVQRATIQLIRSGNPATLQITII